MMPITTGFFTLLIAHVIYGIIHSILASLWMKNLAARLLGDSGKRGYRLFFNIMAVVTYLPVVYILRILPDAHIYSIPFPWIILTGLLQILAGFGLLVGVLQTGLLQFVGLRQWVAPSQPETSPQLVKKGLYRFVRHPLYSCGLVIIWLTPVMTWNILAVNLGLTAYILVAIPFEERKLVLEFGQAYIAYQHDTPALIPGLIIKK